MLAPASLEIDTERNGERRKQVFDILMVLTVVYLPGETTRIISFRPAKRREREAYYDWLENDYDDS